MEYGTPLRLFAETERQSLAAWQELHRFGTDAAALTKDQRVAFIMELRRYRNALTVVEFSGCGALQACAEALK